MMPTVESDLRRKLEEQGFRVEDKKTKDKGWVVKAPEGTDLSLLSNPTGTVHIHTAGLGTERDKIIAILGELRKIGFDPNHKKTASPQPEGPSLEEQTGMEVHKKPEPNPDDPDDRWVTYKEAAEILNISAGGISQRVKAGKLRPVKMPTTVPGFGGGRTKQIQAWHVNVKELLGSGQKGTRGPGGARTSRAPSPVRTRFESTAAGRLSQATAQARAAMRKIDKGFEELQDALKVIDDESMGALNELRDVKARQRDIEGLLERAVGKL
jgi:hypothetical protein